MNKVKRIDRDTNEETVISMKEAIEKLTGWWKNPEQLLKEGLEIYTPYAIYKLIEKP